MKSCFAFLFSLYILPAWLPTLPPILRWLSALLRHPLTCRVKDGKQYTLDSFKYAAVLAVVFTCNHCPTAQAYEDRIIQLNNDYKSRGVAVIAIMPNDPKSVNLDELGYTDMGKSYEEMKLRAKEKDFNFPYLYDGKTETVSRCVMP